MKLPPVKTAKVIGWISLILGVLGVLTSIVPSSTGTAPFSDLLIAFIALVSGFGLIKAKQWGIYAYGISILVSIINTILNGRLVKSFNTAYNASSQLGTGFTIVPVAMALIGFIIFAFEIYLFYLFYSNKEKFSK